MTEGCETEEVEEDQLMSPATGFDVLAFLRTFDCIFSMARSLPVLMLLERSGVRCYNASRGVMHTSQSREDTLTLLQTASLPVPPFWAYEASEDEMFVCEPSLQALLPAWVKAMHPQGVRPGDVTRVNLPLEADTRLLQLQAEGYSDIIVMQHVEGMLVKCYAVVDGTRVLYNNMPQFTSLAQTIAATLDLQVFGFDLVLDAQSQPWIIDVNDWPSFSSVRDVAAPQIARLSCLHDTNLH